jgi:hypothetical protein
LLTYTVFNKRNKKQSILFAQVYGHGL